MTVSTTTTLAGPFIGDGIATVFPFNFLIESKRDITIYITDIDTWNTVKYGDASYSITGIGNPSGGTIVAVHALQVNQIAVIEGSRPLTQNSVFNNQGAFYPKEYEKALDRMTFIAQDMSSRLDRCVHLPNPIIDGYNLQLPKPVGGKAIGWSADGKSLVNLDV